MNKVRCISGLPVLDADKGTRIALVDEVVLNFNQALLYGVVISADNWFSERQFLPRTGIYHIGRDAVMVKGSFTGFSVTETLAVNGVYALSSIVDKPIYTESGKILGVLIDVIFNSKTGELTFYEISDGLLTDLLEGRRFMPFPPAQVFAEDKLLVPESMEKLLQTAL